MDAEGNVSVLLGDPRGAIRSMAVPLFIALVVTEVNTLADRSWCSGLGQEALAAVALCSPLYLVITGLGTGMGVGGAATVSRRIGSGEIDRARVSAIQTLLFSLVFGAILAPILVLTCEDLLVLVGSGDVTQQSYDYMVWLAAGTPVLVLNGAVAGLLRGEGAARASTVMMAILAVTNIVLDPVMVATSGANLISDDAIAALTGKLFPMATVVTPNIPEAEVLTDTLIRVTERVAEVRRAYQPDFPLPTFAEIRRVVQDEWDEDMGKIDPDNASPTADSIGRETADADQEQKNEDAS